MMTILRQGVIYLLMLVMLSTLTIAYIPTYNKITPNCVLLSLGTGDLANYTYHSCSGDLDSEYYVITDTAIDPVLNVTINVTAKAYNWTNIVLHLDYETSDSSYVAPSDVPIFVNGLLIGFFNLTSYNYTVGNTTFFHFDAEPEIPTLQDGDTIKLENTSVIFNFTTANFLTVAAITDVTLNDLTKDVLNYTTWFNCTSCSWWQEADETIVDQSLNTRSAVIDEANVVVGAGSSLYTPDNLSVTLFHKRTTTSTNCGMITKETDGGAAPTAVDWAFGTRSTAEKLFLRIDAGAGLGVCEPVNMGDTFSLNEWHQFGFTFDTAADQIRVYHDGVEIANSTCTATIDDDGDRLAIGTYYAGTAGCRGNYDEVYIYNRTLSNAEMASHNTTGFSHVTSTVSDTQLKAYFSLDNLQSADGAFTLTLVNNAFITDRSSKREFPLESALLISDFGSVAGGQPNGEIVIIDLTTNKLWMRFTGINTGHLGGANMLYGQPTDGAVYQSIAMRDGRLVYGSSGVGIIDFVNDGANVYFPATSLDGNPYGGDISERNDGLNFAGAATQGTPIGSGSTSIDCQSDTDFIYCSSADSADFGSAGVSVLRLNKTDNSVTAASDATTGINATHLTSIFDLLYNGASTLLRKINITSLTYSVGIGGTSFTQDNSTAIVGINAITQEGDIFAGNDTGIQVINTSTFLFSTVFRDGEVINALANTGIGEIWSGEQGNLTKLSASSGAVLASFGSQILSPNVTSLDFDIVGNFALTLIGTDQGANLIQASTNIPPTLSIPDVQLPQLTNLTLNLSMFTTDPDHIVPDDMTWAVFAQNISVAICSIAGENLTIAAQSLVATSTCTINVTDGIDTTFDNFTINVTATVPPGFSFNITDVGIEFMCIEW